MQIKATFKLPRIDFGAYRAALKKTLAEAIAEAAFEWLGATTALIPVWSGASLATFRRLALLINYQIDISPVAHAPNRIDLGLNNSSGKINLEAAGDGQVSFTYGTTLAHLVYNEFNNANIAPDPTLFSQLKNPGPYDFQGRGLDAFNKSVRSVRLPDPFTTLKITTIRV